MQCFQSPTTKKLLEDFDDLAVVAPGAEIRFRNLVKQIKANSDYNESIGAALGIEGSQQIGPDYATLAPVLDLSISGDQVYVNWGWQGHGAFLDQCELQVDRADSKGFVLLAIDTTPGYTDTQPFPDRAGEMDLPGHLPRRRQPRRPMEQPRQHRRRRLAIRHPERSRGTPSPNERLAQA